MRDKESKRAGRSRMTGICALALAAAVLAGCQKTTGGQVVAVVNDDEITQQEVRLEAEAQGLAGNATVPATAKSGLVQRVVERNLLADYARREGLDRGPDYVVRRRLLEQTLLATLAARKLAGTPTVPSAAEVQAYISRNATLFAKRERLAVDQIRFAAPADGQRIKSLVGLGTMDAVATQLTAQNIRFQRGPAALDTASVAPEVARQIVALNIGQPFDVTSGGSTYISAITARAPIASEPAAWTAAATEAVRREKAGKRVTDAVDKLRKEAKITYDPAYQPPARKP